MRDRGVYICQIRIIILFMMPVHMEHNRSRISTIFHDLEQEQEEGIHSNGVFYYWIPTVHSLYTPPLYILKPYPWRLGQGKNFLSHKEPLQSGSYLLNFEKNM